MEEHWRSIQKSEFLASWDFAEKSEQLTIKEVKNEVAQLQKKEMKVVAHFKETHFESGGKVRPMILNSTNLKFLQNKTGIFHQNQWKDIRVEISVVDNNSKIGGDKKLVITKLLDEIKFNIEEFMQISDKAEAKRLASAQHKFMTETQMAQAKQHIDSLK